MALFDLASNDQAVYYLGQIFGTVGVVLNAPTGSGILGTMFQVFNTALLAIGALIVTYTTIVGVVLTAQEGKFLGQRWHSLWIPLRTVMGITALMPTASGYCAIQVVMMWFIVQGVGAADQVWNKVIDYYVMAGGIANAAPQQANIQDSFSIPQNLFPNLVCQAVAAKLKLPQNANATPPQPRPLSNNAGYSFDVAGTPSECGTVNLTANDPKLQAAQMQVLGQILPVLSSLANSYAKAIINDPACWTPCPMKGSIMFFFWQI